MEARRKIKQEYKILVNEALNQCTEELKKTLKELGSQGELVTTSARYAELSIEAIKVKNDPAPSFASKLVKAGWVTSSAERELMQKMGANDDKKIRSATNFHTPKGLPNVWLYNNNPEWDISATLIKRIFNAKRLELSLLAIKKDLFPYDVDDISNIHADFTDFYFHHNIAVALQDYEKRAAALRDDWNNKESVVNIAKLEFQLTEVQNLVQKNSTLNVVDEATSSMSRATLS